VDRAEYLDLTAALDPSLNVWVSVSFEGGGSVREREISLSDLLSCLSSLGPHMDFDDHPCTIRQVTIDFDKRKVRIKAMRQDQVNKTE
jgi:hypothetical protein